MASGFKLSDSREYRRGVILGLTLAEILVLLVFLLLLSLAALILRKDREQALLVGRLDRFTSQLAPLTKLLARRGIEVKDTDQLAGLIERGNAVEGLVRQAQEADQRLKEAREKAELDAAKISNLSAAQKASEEAAKFAAQYAELAAVLERLPAQGDAPPAARLQQVIQHAAASEAASAGMIGQNIQMRNELARVKGNGGSGLPYCWVLPNGQAQYMLIVELQDKDILVRDLQPRARPDDSAWLLLDTVPRNQLMPVADFIGQIAPLQARANADRCKYAIQVVDSTGITNKPGYKQLMGRLWTVFMLHEIPR